MNAFHQCKLDNENNVKISRKCMLALENNSVENSREKYTVTETNRKIG